MDLIERYVNEVGRKLPRKGRQDVKVELNSLLRDSADDRYKGEATEEDIVELLKEFGSPDEVAARYRPANQYLIGPELYPIFRLVVGAVALALTIGLTVAFLAGFIFGNPEPSEIWSDLLSMFSALFQANAVAFASVVLVFAVLQRQGVRPDEDEGEEWDPRTLPEVKDIDRVGRGESAAAIAVGVVFLVLLNVFADRIGIVIIWGEEPLLTNILGDNLIYINIALLLGIVLNIVLLFQGRWHLYTRLVKAVLDLFWIFVVYQIVLTASGEKSAMLEYGLVEPIPSMFVGMGYVVVIIMSISFVVNLVKMIVNQIRQAVVDDSMVVESN